MTGKAGDGLRFALTIDNEKRGDKMRRGHCSFSEKPTDSRCPTEASGTDGDRKKDFGHRSILPSS